MDDFLSAPTVAGRVQKSLPAPPTKPSASRAQWGVLGHVGGAGEPVGSFSGRLEQILPPPPSLILEPLVHAHKRCAPVDGSARGFYLALEDVAAHSVEEASLGATSAPHYECPKCGTILSHPRSITRHRMRCDGIYTLACQLCGEKFFRRDKMKKHMKTKHQL